MNKNKGRTRRANKVRSRLEGKIVLCVHRTPKHIQAQVLNEDRSRVLASASSLESSVRSLGYTGNCDAAKQVGQLVAERAKQAGVKTVSFDRRGFRYHGRIAALADSARESGLQF
jgi:large subunit ribosomal protein L18